MRQASESTVLFSAVIRPHRSAGRHAATVVVVLVAAVLFLASIGFIAVGAWPVAPFLGLEVLLLAGALSLNRRAGTAYEAINLTRQTLTVKRVNHWGRQTAVSFPPNWLQVNLEEPVQRWSPLELRSHGRSLVIGSFLLPEERLRLARSLRRELDRLTRTSFAT